MTNRAPTANKDLGAVRTPTALARFLVEWAIRDPADAVLDLGTGEGVFLIEAFERLTRIGADREHAVHQLAGVEVDQEAFGAFQRRWNRQVGAPLPAVKLGDFFDAQFPTVDAVIGNPPYVARTRLERIDLIRQKVFGSKAVLKGFGRLTDLYAYFLLYASRFLRTGGRLAVVVSSSWLDANYGRGMKQFLCGQFAIDGIFSFRRKMFPDASVKPVLLLATKTDPALTPSEKPVRFIQVSNTFAAEMAWEAMGKENGRAQSQNYALHVEPQSRLHPASPWGIYLKAPAVYFSVVDNPRITELHTVASTRIGLQTLGKDFYLLDRQRVQALGLQPEYRQPVAFSPREYSRPVLDEGTVANYFAFYCDQPKDQLAAGPALKHIAWGEQHLVPVRGKKRTVTGYHNQERIRQAGRTPWYNIKTEIDRRGRMPVLIPRRVYENYLVLWNRAGFVPNEDFIEAMPRRHADLVPFLAVLNSSLMEFMFRTHAHVYGGGVFNLNPGPVRHVPTLDIRLLGEGERRRLEDAYEVFLEAGVGDRHALDKAVFGLLGIEGAASAQLLAALDEMRALARHSKQRPQ